MIMELTSITGLKGEVSIPGDKSISHRSVMFASLANGMTEIHNFLSGADCLATIDCFRKMGIKIEEHQNRILVHGKGLHGLTAPSETLQVKNSGTTTRLLSGILAGQPFSTSLSGDESLNSRPMKRIIEPLTQMGAHMSRNHTELMLKEFGADIRTVHQLAGSEATSVIQPCPELHGQKITVPGDISSAAYFIAAGLLVPDSEILVKNVGINPTRAGLLKVCEDMGGNITLLNERTEAGEKMADILVRSSQLHGISIHGDIIPTLIDEIPIIAVMAACAEGTTIIRDAQELRVKETDRIETITDNLIAMGCSVLPTEDGMVIKGGEPLKGATIHTLLDHRIAMAFSIAALVADGRTKILDSHCIDVSYPGFYDAFEHLL